MSLKAIDLGEGERIIATIRRHWFHLGVEAVTLVFLYAFLATGVGMAEVYVAAQQPDLFGKAFGLGMFLLALVGLLLWTRFFIAWSDHWLDAWIITDKRIIDIEQRGFFSRQVSNFPLDRVQDVTYNISGVVPMWLHFGDVRIQTASISKDLIMRQVPFPDLVKEQVMQVLPERH